MVIWSSALKPTSASAMDSLTFCTAFNTPFPRKRFASPSRSSTASNSPVDAPDGTAARPNAPSSKMTSTSTVGLPRESITSRPMISVISNVTFSCITDELPRNAVAEWIIKLRVERDRRKSYSVFLVKAKGWGQSFALLSHGLSSSRRARFGSRSHRWESSTRSVSRVGTMPR